MRKTRTDRGALFQRNGRSAFVRSSSKNEAKLVELGDYLNDVNAAITAKYSEQNWQPEIRKATDLMHNQFRTLYRSIIDSHHDNNKRIAKTNEPAALTDSAWEAEFRTAIRALEPADRPAAVAGLSYAQSSALVRYGDLQRLGLPDRSVEAVLQGHRVNGIVEQQGIRANHAGPSTLSNPVPGSVDEAAACRAGEAVIAALDAEGEALQHDAGALAGLVAIAAEASGQDADKLWCEVAA